MLLHLPDIYVLNFGILLFIILLALSIIDVKSYLLPNFLTLPLIPAGIAQGWVLTQDWKSGIIGAIIGYSTFVMIEHWFKRIRGKDGLGRGDAKLLAVGGAWCGWAALPHIVLVGSCTGLLFVLYTRIKPAKHKNDALNEHIPFGPFLALAIFSVWLYAQIQ